MATSRSTRFSFITRLALTFVVIVTLGVAGENLNSDVPTTNGNSAVARSSRSAKCQGCYGGCPVEKGYVLYNSRCLKLYTNKQDYETARRRCEADGAHLFNLKSREEDGPALLYLMDTMGQVLLEPGRGVWAGANDIVNEGSFLWSDRTPLSKDSGFWASGQPDDYQGKEDCVEVGYLNAVLLLNDNQCSLKMGFVCQADIKKQ